MNQVTISIQTGSIIGPGLVMRSIVSCVAYVSCDYDFRDLLDCSDHFLLYGF